MRRRVLGMALASALAASLSVGGAQAENRVALVIGNAAYQTVPPLPNPVNDAKAIADLLTSAGFEVVSVADLTQTDMRRAIADFSDRIAGKGTDTVVLVHYAGHGLQVDGENFLVPVDARITREADVPLQAVRLADLMNALSAAPSRSRIVLLDACRNNPFSEINKVTGRGLAIVDAPAGSIVSYSTAPGAVAEDGAAQNSPYTAALLATVKEEGMPIEQAFKRVRYSVHQATGGRQTPWESSSLTDDFTFFPGGPSGSKARTGSRRKPAAIPENERLGTALGKSYGARTVESWRKELQGKPQAQAYEIVIGEDTVEAYEAYLDLFPASAVTARLREIVGRRKVMADWYVAVTANTPAAYRSFLAQHPGSDFAPTAQRLLARSVNRQIATEAPVRVATTCNCAPTRRRADRSAPGRQGGGAQGGARQAIQVAPVPLGAIGPIAPRPPYIPPRPPVTVHPPVVVNPPSVPYNPGR